MCCFFFSALDAYYMALQWCSQCRLTRSYTKVGPMIEIDRSYQLHRSWCSDGENVWMRLVEVEIVMHAYMIAVCNLQSSDEVFMSQIECIFFFFVLDNSRTCGNISVCRLERISYWCIGSACVLVLHVQLKPTWMIDCIWPSRLSMRCEWGRDGIVLKQPSECSMYFVTDRNWHFWSKK